MKPRNKKPNIRKLKHKIQKATKKRQRTVTFKSTVSYYKFGEICNYLNTPGLSSDGFDIENDEGLPF